VVASFSASYGLVVSFPLLILMINTYVPFITPKGVMVMISTEWVIKDKPKFLQTTAAGQSQLHVDQDCCFRRCQIILHLAGKKLDKNIFVLLAIFICN